MSFDENRFEKKGDSINIYLGDKKKEPQQQQPTDY